MEKTMSSRVPGLDKALNLFKSYLSGDGDFDELEFKEWIIDYFKAREGYPSFDDVLKDLKLWLGDWQDKPASKEVQSIILNSEWFRAREVEAKIELLKDLEDGTGYIDIDDTDIKLLTEELQQSLKKEQE
jgi:hypothetical protein